MAGSIVGHHSHVLLQSGGVVDGGARVVAISSPALAIRGARAAHEAPLLAGPDRHGPRPLARSPPIRVALPGLLAALDPGKGLLACVGGGPGALGAKTVGPSRGEGPAVEAEEDRDRAFCLRQFVSSGGNREGRQRLLWATACLVHAVGAQIRLDRERPTHAAPPVPRGVDPFVPARAAHDGSFATHGRADHPLPRHRREDGHDGRNGADGKPRPFELSLQYLRLGRRGLRMKPRRPLGLHVRNPVGDSVVAGGTWRQSCGINMGRHFPHGDSVSPCRVGPDRLHETSIEP